MIDYKEDIHLVKEQMELELGMKEAGKARYDKQLREAIARGQQEETSFGDRIMGGHIQKVAWAVEGWIRANTGKAGANNLALPYLSTFDSKIVAMLGLKVVVSQLMSDQAKLTATLLRIARLLEDEMRCTELRAADRRAYKGIMKAANTKGEYKRKIETVRFLAKQDEQEWATWPTVHCMHIGMAVFNCIQAALNLVEVYDVPDRRGHRTSFLRPRGETKEWVKEHVEQARMFCAPVLEPMVVRPLPWVAGELRGGYLSDHIPRRPLIKTRNKAHLEQLKYADMPKVLQAVNAAQNTAWRINRDVLDLLTYIASTDSELGDVPPANLRPLPVRPASIEYDEEARKDYRIAARAVHEANVKITSKRISFMMNLDTARRYSKYDNIYMPVQLDFRGRVYFMCQLNPQGADYIKALLEFAEAKPLGEYGLEWLKIHIANLFGVDKVSFNERVQWVDDNMEMMFAISRAPMQNREWCDADKPFQAYAAVRDMVAAIESGEPEKHMSRIAIALDGSCSGIQNLSLAFRDEIGGDAVNLIPNEKPADIYRSVAEKTVRELEKLSVQKPQDAENGQSGEEDNRTPVHKLAQWWLDYGVTRKVTKRNCMTFPYGSKQRGFSDQILEDTLRPFINEGNADSPLLQTNERGKLDTIYPTMELSNFLAKLNYQSVQQTVLKAAEAMDWMQEAARMVAKEGRPVCWTTPLGLPVVQNYVQTKEARVETKLAGARKILTIRESTLKPDTRKAANSISPNVVHSLDSSHLQLIVANSIPHGIDAFALVHDSFGTHAGDTEKFYDIIRESFIELYAGDVFQDLSDEFKSQVHPDKHEAFPLLPVKGNLEPEVIMNSLYCFA